MGYIYRITNTINNKYYIGITTKLNPNDRWRAHINSIKYDNGCPLLVKAFNKYGVDKFKFEVLIICFDEDLYQYEKEYILKYNSLSPNGYNVHPGGEFGGNFKGRRHTDEAKHKIGIKSSEYNKSEEVRQKRREIMINFNKANNVGELMRKSIKWQESNKKRQSKNALSDETRSKISTSIKLYFENNGSTINKEKHSEIMTRVNGRKVSQYSKDGVLIKTYDSIILASKDTGIGRCSIQAASAGRNSTGGGYIWKYTEKQ